jgi:hypothetical protein
MKKIIIIAVTLMVGSCGPGENELKLYNDQKIAVENQITKTHTIEKSFSECIKNSPDSCTGLKEQFQFEITYLSSEIDVLRMYASDGGMTDKADEIGKFREMSNKFAEKLKK